MAAAFLVGWVGWPATFASAEDAVAGPRTFAIELSFDQILFEVANAASSNSAPQAADHLAPSVAPFADMPPIRLGAPNIDPNQRVSFDAPPFMSRCSTGACADLAAQFAVRAENNDVSFSFGATAGVADRLSSLAPSSERSRFYLFVAADAQAMSFSFAGREQPSSVQLDDMRLVGDAQAGVGARLGGGDLAVGYITREISHMGADRRENFVGLTFGWDG